MDTLHAMRAFVRIVDSGSLTAAADALGVSQPAMVRTLAALERELGVRLLNRSTRRMSLTDEGRDYYARCGSILAAVEEAGASLRARRAEPSGTLRLTASVPFGRLHVAPLISEFLAAHPRMRVDLMLLDRVIDLIEEGIDLAVRVGSLADSSMVAVPLGTVRRLYVGSPALLTRLGRPREPADLARGPCVSFSGMGATNEWSIADGRKTTCVAVTSVLATNQIDAATSACIAGLGWGCFFDYHVAEALRSGQLVEVLDHLRGQATPVNIVYPQARLLSPNVRAFVDFAAPRLRARLGAQH